MLKFILFVFLVSTILSHSEVQCNCGALTSSTCFDSVTTKWNNKSIGQSLINWIESLNKIESLTGGYKDHIFLTKNIKEFSLKNKVGSGIQYIANIDCSTEKSIGPAWMKPSTYSNDPIHDGFLYGLEDQKGELTGCLEIRDDIDNFVVDIVCHQLCKVYIILYFQVITLFLYILTWKRF